MPADFSVAFSKTVEVLGPEAAALVPLLTQVVEHLPSRDYYFMPEDEFASLLTSDLRSAMRVYWTEIVCRAHIAASASLVRTKRWVEGILDSVHRPNYTVFMACFRGCLEASADTFHSLGTIPFSIADCHAVIRRAAAGELDQPRLFQELEDALIHFTHARHVAKGEAALDLHRARTTREYLESLASGIKQCPSA